MINLKLLKLIISVILLLFLFSCSSSTSIYKSDYPLTSDIANSESQTLTVNIPKGWFTADDNQENKSDLWLVRDDYSATISFTPIIFDEEIKDRYGNSNLSEIVNYSKLSQKLAHLNKFIDLLKNESFEMNGIKFNSYQFAGKQGNLYRVVVFEYGDHFYECIAVIKPPQSAEKKNEIFSTQNSVLNSIKN